MNNHPKREPNHGSYLAILNVTRHTQMNIMPYATSVALDQPAHPHSLIREVHRPLVCMLKATCLRICEQCITQIRLRANTGASLSAYVRRPYSRDAS